MLKIKGNFIILKYIIFLFNIINIFRKVKWYCRPPKGGSALFGFFKASLTFLPWRDREFWADMRALKKLSHFDLGFMSPPC